MSSTIALIIIGVAVLFIIGIKLLASPKTARLGNLVAAAGMLVALLTLHKPTGEYVWSQGWTLNYTLIAIGTLIGLVIGAIGAYSVKMTAMPQMVALFNGLGGGAAALVASLEFIKPDRDITTFIAATMRDVFQTVPPVFKESAYGVGCTTWEVMRSIVVPYTRASVVGGIMLGLGRALGETMAVTFVIGNTNRITTSLFGPGNTIASIVALEFPESQAGSLKLSSLLALGFILFVISFIVLAISRLLLRPRSA